MRARALVNITLIGLAVAACSPKESKQNNASVKLDIPAGLLAPAPDPSSPSAAQGSDPETCAQRCVGLGAEVPTCIKRCTEYNAGYQWAEKRHIVSTARCVNDADSFIQGCLAYALESSTGEARSEERKQAP